MTPPMSSPKNPIKSKKEPINGILLVNKPQGLTSNGVLQRVKRLFNAEKAGHTGSLDPLATGMLPICFGEATKFSQYLLDADKTYRATGLLGIKTTTGDACGEVVSRCDNFSITESELMAIMQAFIGQSLQTPSMFSALKHKGTPLYKYAREGISIDRDPRMIDIKKLVMTAFDGKHFDIEVTCSKGTYIRNLVEDIGERLGVGAHVTVLHRVYTAGFADQAMYSLEALEQADKAQLLQYLLPMESAVASLPALRLENNQIAELRLGRTLAYETDQSIEQSVRLYDRTGQFAGLACLEPSGILKAKRLLSEQTYLNRQAISE